MARAAAEMADLNGSARVPIFWKPAVSDT